MTDTTAVPTSEPARKVFKTAKLLTRPVLKFDVGITRYIRITSPIFMGKEMKASGDKKRMEPAHIAEVTNLEDGRPAQIIVNAVTLSVLEENFPSKDKDGKPLTDAEGKILIPPYVGKCFAMTKRDKAEGKQYFPFNVEVLEDPDGETTAPETKAEMPHGVVSSRGGPRSR